MDFNRIRDLREQLALSQNDVANILNISRGRYNQYETGHDIFPIKHLVSVIDYFEVSLDYIFRFIDFKQYENNHDSIDVNKSKKRMKDLRNFLNLTQDEFSKVLNSANTTISGYERGTRIIATSFLYDICKRYKVSADYLLGRIDFIPDWCNSIAK